MVNGEVEQCVHGYVCISMTDSSRPTAASSGELSDGVKNRLITQGQKTGSDPRSDICSF